MLNLYCGPNVHPISLRYFFTGRNFYCTFGTMVVEMEHLMASLVQHELLVGHHQLMVWISHATCFTNEKRHQLFNARPILWIKYFSYFFIKILKLTCFHRRSFFHSFGTMMVASGPPSNVINFPSYNSSFLKSQN